MFDLLFVLVFPVYHGCQVVFTVASLSHGGGLECSQRKRGSVDRMLLDTKVEVSLFLFHILLFILGDIRYFSLVLSVFRHDRV